MTELLPCPFCGAVQVDDDTIPYTGQSRTCDNMKCNVESPNWNHRPIEDELRRRIAELTAELATQRELIGRPAEAILGEYSEMRKELEALREAQRWIPVGERWVPVGERLPENGMMCLVALKLGDDWMDVKRLKCNKSFSSGWEEVEYDDFAGCEVNPPVTHWRHLPPAPEELYEEVAESGRKPDGNEAE